jgi:hypothetical protein
MTEEDNRMPFTRYAAVAALAACVSLAAGAADRRETRTIASFKAIGVSAPVRVELTQGDAESLVVECDEEALAQLETLVENGALKIRQKTRERVPKLEKVKAYVTARNIDSLSISGSGYIRSPSLRTSGLSLSISGSGDLRIATLTATRLDVSLSGSGDMSVAGTADSISASISGSGDLEAKNFQVAEADVSIAGSGAATLSVRDRLSARVAGSGDLRYYGDPPSVHKSVAGSGSVRRAGATPS